MSLIPEQFDEVRQQIAATCLRCNRALDSVQLIAVSKTVSVEDIRQGYDCGQRVFGESRLQEALPKMEALPGSIEWHYIGRLQSNKLRKILAQFDVIHSVDSYRMASLMDSTSKELGVYPKIFLQVNIDQEENKGGFSIDKLRVEIADIYALGRVEVQGLMCIPEDGSIEQARDSFRRLRVLKSELEVQHGVKLPFLSMGMSGDYQIAIEEGATHIRVGSSLFGKRG